MTVDDLMAYYKCRTQGELCKKLKVSRVTIWKWLKNGIPYKTQALYQVKTSGELKAKPPSDN